MRISSTCGSTWAQHAVDSRRGRFESFSYSCSRRGGFCATVSVACCDLRMSARCPRAAPPAPSPTRSYSNSWSAFVLATTTMSTRFGSYEAHREAHPGSPTFDELIDEGWFGVVWGRITTELNTRMSARQEDEPLRSGLRIVFDARKHDATFAFDDVSDLSPAAQQLAARLAEHPAYVRTITAPSPDWIAARLWERRPNGGDAEALRWWVDRWRLLHRPPGSPTAWWTESDARAWRRAAFDVIRNDPGLVAWNREKALIDARLSHERGRILRPDPPSAHRAIRLARRQAHSITGVARWNRAETRPGADGHALRGSGRARASPGRAFVRRAARPRCRTPHAACAARLSNPATANTARRSTTPPCHVRVGLSDGRRLDCAANWGGRCG